LSSVIFSLGKVMVNSRFSNLFLTIDNKGTKQCKHHLPHGHILYKKERGAVISLDSPFDILAGENTSEHRHIDLVRIFLKEHTLYIHFAWDYYAEQTVYAKEYADPAVKAQCHRWASENFRSGSIQINSKLTF